MCELVLDGGNGVMVGAFPSPNSQRSGIDQRARSTWMMVLEMSEWRLIPIPGNRSSRPYPVRAKISFMVCPS